MSKYIALIPAYMPEEPLLQLVCQLNSAEFSVVLVNDGSGETCARLFDSCGKYAKVLNHQTNAGKGSALKTGISYIYRRYGPDHIVVTVDADGQHRVDDAAAVCRRAEQDPGCLILGSRRMGKNVPLRSRFGNTVTRLVYRLSAGVRVYDTQTGLRAFDSSLIPTLLAIPGERYEYEMNVLLFCAREKIRIIEQEIETIYINNNAASHFDTLKDSARIYKEILKFSAASLTGFFVDYALFSFLILLSGNLLVSNVVARAVSAGVNFTLNRWLVFKSRENLAKAAVPYFLLAALILAGNTAVLEILVNFCGFHELSAKILTELFFFFFSWVIQKYIIFGKGGAH